MIITQYFEGLKLIGGYQFWSNPAARDDDRAIPIILARPTLLDIIYLLKKYPADRLLEMNSKLLALGEIKPYTFNKNLDRINRLRGVFE